MPFALPALGRILAKRVDLPPPGPELFGRLGGLRQPALLDSAAGGRYTLVAAAPLARLRWTAGGKQDFPALLREALAATQSPGPAPLPLGPGWIGVFGYGLRRAFEHVPERHREQSAIPDVSLGYFPAVAIHDAREEVWRFLWREGAEQSLRALQAGLLCAARPLGFRIIERPKPRTGKQDYLIAVRRTIEYIHAGDVFQVNYAHEFQARHEGDPLALYLALRRHNPAPYSAFLGLGEDCAILSTSPELFLSVRGRRIVTRPIKGTRPRDQYPRRDAEQIAALRQSAKDAAELAMIVDLERNDLGRVCAPGSVVVADRGRIESYASVHHLVAEVTGELEEGRDRVDLLAAAFPGGSITGAPKVRAMEIIDEIEVGRRGPYTGAMGLLTDDGNMELNIAIRTPILARGVVHIHVGGGIVADSDPHAEYQETLDKGRAIFEALAP